MIVYQTEPTPRWSDPRIVRIQDGRRVILTDREADGLATDDGPVEGAAEWMNARIRALRGER